MNKDADVIIEFIHRHPRIGLFMAFACYVYTLWCVYLGRADWALPASFACMFAFYSGD